MKKRVLLGMSGGVDSSVAAILLKEQGYEVVGATMKLWEDKENSEGCGSVVAANDAEKVCKELEIEHYVLDLKKEFKECVIKNFIETYNQAMTPNPCIQCNKHMKFNYFYKKALELGCEYIATGHYAKTEYSKEYNQYVLKKSNAGKKDQSYVLYNIPNEIISKVLFPLGKFESKEEIREIAKKYGLNVAKKPDSQEICFIPDNDYVGFLSRNSNNKQLPGKIIHKNGKVLGKHNGLINYTVGQRKGLGISNPTPLYVIKLEQSKNQVIVGEEKDIYSNELFAKDINYTLNIDIQDKMQIQAKIRYNASASDAVLYPVDKNKAKIQFKEPQRAITKGQSVVFYIDDIVLRRRNNSLKEGDVMKSEKGITLMTLGIYIVLILIVIGILTTIGANFQSGIKDINQEGIESSEIDKFNIYFLQEVKRQGNEIESVKDSEITFTSNNKYIFENETINLVEVETNKKIVLSENIESCNFSKKIENGKTIIEVIIKAKNVEQRTIEYVLTSDEYFFNYEDEENYFTISTE